MSAAADPIHPEFFDRICTVVDGRAPDGYVDHVAADLHALVREGGNGVELVVDNDQYFERIDLGERRHGDVRSVLTEVEQRSEKGLRVWKCGPSLARFERDHEVVEVDVYTADELEGLIFSSTRESDIDEHFSNCKGGWDTK